MVKLRVGRNYKDREGNIVIIKNKRWAESWIFRTRIFYADNYHYYTKDGRLFRNDKLSHLDLVEEVTDPVLRLEVGKKYINGIGGIVEITKESFGLYRDSIGHIYFVNGKSVYIDGNSRNHLIAEYEEPKMCDEKCEAKATELVPGKKYDIGGGRSSPYVFVVDLRKYGSISNFPLIFVDKNKERAAYGIEILDGRIKEQKAAPYKKVVEGWVEYNDMTPSGDVLDIMTGLFTSSTMFLEEIESGSENFPKIKKYRFTCEEID
jgi:hypothetical protein